MRDRARRAIEECRLIAQMSEEPDRITRRFLTPPMHDVHARLRERMTALGMSVDVDAMGICAGFGDLLELSPSDSSLVRTLTQCPAPAHSMVCSAWHWRLSGFSLHRKLNSR